MAESPCVRQGHGAASPTSFDHQQEKDQPEASLKPQEDHHQQQQQRPEKQRPLTVEESAPVQHHQSPKDSSPPPKQQSNPNKPETLLTKPQTALPTSETTAETAPAAAPVSVSTSSKHSLRSPVFADLPVSSSASSKGIETLLSKLGGSKSRGSSVVNASGIPSSTITVTSKGKPTYERMEALGGSGYPYGASYMVPGNAQAYKPGGSMPPPQLHLRGPWPPPHIEGYASLPVGASSLYPPYLSLSGLSPSAAPLGGVSFLPQPSTHGSDGQPVPATIHPPQTDSKSLISHHHLSAMKEKDSLLDSPKHHATTTMGKPRHPTLLPPKMESDVSAAMRAGKHDKLVSREGHGNDSQTRQNQHQTSGKRHVKEETHPPHVESGASKNQGSSSSGWEGSESRTHNKRAGQGGGEGGKGNSPPSLSQSKEKRENGSGAGGDGPERKKKSSKKRLEHADENGNSLKTNDGKAIPSGKTLSDRLASPPGVGKVATPGIGIVNSVGTVLSVGVESYTVPGEIHHTASLLKTVSPPLTVPSGLSEASKQLQKASPGVSPALSPGDASQNHTKKHSPKETVKRTPDGGGLKHGKDDKRDERLSKDTQSTGDKLTSPNLGATPPKVSPQITATTVNAPSPTQATPTISPSNTSNATVHLGYMPMYLPNTCQLSLDKETNKDAPKSGTKVHATTFVPAPGEFIPGPATNATAGVSSGKDTKCKTSPSLPVSTSNGKSPTSHPGKSKSSDATSATNGKKESPKSQLMAKAVTQAAGEKCDGGSRMDDKKSSSKSPCGDHTDSVKGSSILGVESKEDMHSKHDDIERREFHGKKRHVSGNSSGLKYDSRSESKPDRTSSSHSSGKHSSRARSVSGPDPGMSGLMSPREYSSKHGDRHSNEKSLEDHRRMDLVTGRVGHPSLYYDMAMVGDRSRTDTTLPLPTYHSDCFTTSSAAAHEAALARHQESMLRTALMGSAHRGMPSGTGGTPLVSSPSSQPFIVSSHASSVSSSHTPSNSKRTVGSTGEGTGIQGRGTPGIKVSDGRCPPIGIAVAQQRQDGDGTGTQGRHPPRSSSRSASSSPHISRVLPSSSSLSDKRETDDERIGRNRDAGSGGHGRLSEREQRTRDQSPRESRSSSEVSFHVGAHRRYQHDLSANLVVTGGGTIGRPDTTIHPHLPATPHHWLPRPPSHTSATPSPLWPYGIPSSSSPMNTSTLEASPRGSPFPVGPGGMHWAQDPTTGQLMLVPPHPVHPDSPLSNLVWPRYLVPPHLQPHSHQLQQLMLNQFPYGPIPGPAHPSQHPGLLSHIPGAGSSAEVQALIQQQHEAIANMYRQAEQHERSRKEQQKPPSSDPSSLKPSSDSMKCGSGHHRNRRESGDVKGEVRPESRQSERCRTGSQEPLDIKHSIQHPQPPFLQAIPVAAASQHPSLPFMYPPSVPYLYENPPPVSGTQTPSSRASQDSKDKKEFLADRSHVMHTQIPPLRPSKDKKEGVLKSTSVQTSPAETPPAPTAKVEDDREEENDSDVNNQSAKVSRTQQTEMNQQKLLIEPNIDVVTVDSPELTGTSTPLLSSETVIAQTKTEDDVERETAGSHEQFKQASIQNDVKSTDVISVKEEEIKDNNLQSEEEDSVLRTSNESQSEEVPQCEGDHKTDHLSADADVPATTPIIVTSTSAVSESTPAATTVFTESASTSASVPTTSRESLITNVMTTMQTFASTVDGLDQDQLAAIEGIALLSEVAERKALASRAEFWNCVAEQHRTENSDEVDDAESTTTESNVPLQGNSVSAMTSNGGCDLDDDDLAGISPGELSLKIRCPITIKKEANGRSEVSACGTPLGSAENMNPMELEMRMKLAELQRKYKEKKKELDKLQKKKDKKAREDSKNGSSPTVEKRRGRGRPRKRKFSNKSTTEVQEETPKEVPKENPKEKEVKTLHSSATVLLEAAASLEEPVVPKKKKKKEHKTRKESQKGQKELKESKENKEMKEQIKEAKEQQKEHKEKTTKLGKKGKKLKTKVDSSGTPLTISSSGEAKTHIKKKKDKTKSLHLKSGLEGQLTALKVKGSKSGKKRTGSPIRSDISSKKHKSASKKLNIANLTSHDSFTSDTDSGSIIWPSKATPTKATPSSPSSASTTKPPKSPKIKTKTKFSKKMKSKEGKLSLHSGKKKKTKSKDAGATSPAVSTATNSVAAALPRLDGLNVESKLKPGLLISHVYGEDSDSTLEEGSTATTNTSSQPSSWSSHKGLALLAELSSNQSSSCSATPTKVKKKKIKDKTKSLSSSSTSDGATGKSKTTTGLKQPGTGKVGGKKVKVLKKKVLSGSGEKRTVLKKLKKVSKADKDSKSSITSSKNDKPKKAKQVTASSSTTTTTTTTTTKNESKTSQHTSPNQAGSSSSAPAPQFDERSWCRRRSERIFLSDISPVQSRDISPQRKAELAEPAKRKVLQSPSLKKAVEPSGSQGQSSVGSTNQGGLVTQIGSVLDALKTDPLQMRKKLIRLSAQEDEEDDDGRPQDETRRKKLKKKAKKKDKTPTQDKLNPLELALKALEQESTDSSDSDGENVPLSSLVERPSTPAPRNCVLSVEELQDGLRVLIPIDGLFHAGNVRAIQPPDVYGVVIEGGRGSRPHVFSQEQILQEAIADVKPSSTRYLPEGTRICAYWSQQYKYLYPGTVVKGSPNPTLDSNFTTVEFDDGDSGRIPLDHIRMLPQDYPLVDFEPSPIMVQRKRRRRPSETSSTTEWKMDLVKSDDMDDRMDEYSWRSQSSKDDAQAISEGDNDVFLPSAPKLKKTGDGKTKKVLTKKGKSKLKLKTKAKGVSGQKGLSSNLQQSGNSSLKQKMGKLTKLKKRKGISPTSKFSQKMMQKGQAKSFAVKAKKTKLASSAASTDRKGVPAKKKGPKKKLGASGKAKCTVEIETVYSSEVYADDLDYPEGIGGTIGSFDSDDSSDDESDHYTKSANTMMKKKKMKKKKKGSVSSSCNVQAFSPPRQFWRWLGKATQRRGSKGKARKLFYKSIVRDKEIIRVGECAIFLSTGRPHLPYIGRIESMWESWGGMMVVRVKWFYHPEETKGGRKPNDGKMALYLSQHVDENDVQTISHKCEVLSLDDYKQYVSGKKSLNTMVRASDIYYLAGTYDPGSGHTVSAN